MKQKKTEIERRFLVKRLPESLESFPRIHLLQGYLVVSGDREIRIREKNHNDYFMTLKVGDGEERIERETKISKDIFDEFWPEILGRPVRRWLYEIPYENSVINVDIFLDDFEGNFRAEVEFPTKEEARKFVPLDWLGKEVTDDTRYNCRNIALQGIPKTYAVAESTAAVIDIPTFDVLNIPTYNLEEGIKQLVRLIRKKMVHTSKNLLVHIAGGTSSGKTNKVAEEVRKILGYSVSEIRSLDNYYLGKSDFLAMKKFVSDLHYDHPAAFELWRAKTDYVKSKDGEEVEEPVYDFDTGLRIDYKKKFPKKVIIVEGIFALHEDLECIADIKVFVETGMHGRLIRRLLRDAGKDSRTSWPPEKTLRYFAEVAEPAHQEFIETGKNSADMIILNEYDPKVEAQRSGLHELQIKFEKKLEPQSLIEKGACQLTAATWQSDAYYNPEGLDLTATDEMVRIRQDTDGFVITYKGPKTEGTLRHRPKFELPIEYETAQAFLKMYGKEIVRIQKDRLLFKLDEVVIALDKVIKFIQDDEISLPLGDFVELRTLDTDEKGVEKIISVAEKLGLDMKDAIRESYIEL